MSAAKWKNDYEIRRRDFQQLPKRIQILLATQYANKFLPIFEKECPHDELPRQSVEIAFCWAIDPSEHNTRIAAELHSIMIPKHLNIFYGSYTNEIFYAFYCIIENINIADNSVVDTTCVAETDEDWDWLYQTYLHTKGPSFPFQNNWKTTDTIALAKTILQDRNLTPMPILADALQDAGMQDETLLKHLQKDECTFADWTLTNLLGFWT